MREHGEERLADGMRFLLLDCRCSQPALFGIILTLLCAKSHVFFFFFKQPAESNQAREHAAVEDALIILSCRFLKKNSKYMGF